MGPVGGGVQMTEMLLFCLHFDDLLLECDVRLFEASDVLAELPDEGAILAMS